MDITDNRLTTPRILPFCTIGGSERRLCAVMPLPGGDVLALQATCVLGKEPAVTVFSSLLAAGKTGWGPVAARIIDLSLPAALLPGLPPVLTGSEAEMNVVWPLGNGGTLSFAARHDPTLPETPPRIGDGPGQQEATAFCAQDGYVYAATRRKGEGGADVFRRAEGAGDWQSLGAGSLPCHSGEAVTALAVFDGRLHAAVSDRRNGFSLWRTASGQDGRWETVMTHGAWRYGYNPVVSAMTVAGGRLLVAAGGVDTSQVLIGDEHPEIFTVRSDGTWRLFSGQARFTPDGLRQPETSGGPGTPAKGGTTVGGFETRGDELLIWLRPHQDDTESISICRWTAATGEWTEVESLLPSALHRVTSLAMTEGGTVIIAGHGDILESGGQADVPRRPLLLIAVPAK
jgi:hypothetical protein